MHRDASALTLHWLLQQGGGFTSAISGIRESAAKLGDGLSALDDITCNVVSGAMHKFGEGCEWLGTHTRRLLRDDLGLSQRFAQNAGDVVQLIAEFFAPGAVAKGISSASKIVGAAKFRSALGERFGLFKGDVSASQKEIGSLSKNTVEQVAFRRPISLDIIKESEMIKRAAELPGDWKGQFKLIKEIPQTRTGTEFASEVYCRQVLFKDPKTGQMFRVFQRNDIDPNYVIPKGRNRGKTNLEAMLKGHTPYTINGQMVQLHHMGQNARGSLVEVTEKTHRAFPHKQFGQNNPHPTNPVIRSEFDSIREAYWRAYAEQFK